MRPYSPALEAVDQKKIDFITESHKAVAEKIDELTNAFFVYAECSNSVNKQKLTQLIAEIKETFVRINAYAVRLGNIADAVTLFALQDRTKSLQETFVLLENDYRSLSTEEYEHYDESLDPEVNVEFEIDAGDTSPFVEGSIEALLEEMNAPLLNLHVATNSDHFDSLYAKEELMSESLETLNKLFRTIQEKLGGASASPDSNIAEKLATIERKIAFYTEELSTISGELRARSGMSCCA